MHRRNYLSAAARRISTAPRAALLLFTALLLPLIAAGGGLRPDNSLAVWFVADDPALTDYRKFLADFGNDEAILVAWSVRDPEGAGGDAQSRLVDELRSIEGIARLAAPAKEPPGDGERREPSGRDAVTVVAWLDAGPEVEAQRGRILADVESVAARALGTGDFRLAGTGVLYEGLNRQTVRDTGVFLGLALLVMLLLLGFTLRSARALIVVLVPPLLAAGASLGIAALSGRPFTVLGSALPTLVLVIALADAIHVLLHYWRVRREDPPADEAGRRRQVADAVAWVAVPCLFTSITTAAGFLALTTSRIAVVRDFGLLAAAGMLLAWIVALAFLAAALAAWDIAPPATPLRPKWLQALPGWIAARLRSMRTAVLTGAAVLTVVLAVGAFRLDVDTHTIGLLSEQHRVRRDSDWIERTLGNYTPLEFVVTSPEGVSNPSFLAKLGEWRRRAELVPEVSRTFTALDLAAAAPGGTEWDVDRSAYVRRDGSAIRVTAYVPMGTARDFERVANRLESEGQAVFGSAGSVRASGYLPLYVRIIDYVVDSTISGLAVAFVLVFLFVALLLRSLKATGAAVVANLLPIAAVFGLMGWSGIPLDIATATVGAIVLGLVVDDTIHVLFRYRGARAEGADSTSAAAYAVRDAGPAMTLTTLVLASGFAVMIAAGTKSIAYFGLVATVAILAALAADLVLLPALLIGPRRRSREIAAGAEQVVAIAGE